MLRLTSITALAISILTFFLVGARALAALFASYMFQGHGGGYITLGKQTGIIFSVSMVLYFGLTVFLWRSTSKVGASFPARMFGASSLLTVLSISLYAAIAFSPLNQWRP